MKNNILRILFFMALVLSGFSGPLWFFVVGVVLYIFLYRGLEVILLAAAIDAYFGYATNGWFVYTITVALGVFVAQWAKPHLSVYNQQN